jgi:two-component system, NarL family, nitrate/nitrite response regulator NarL
MKILVADDHSLFADALSCLLEMWPDVSKVIKASDYASTMRSLSDNVDTHIALLDLRMPGLSLPAGVGSIRELLPDVKLIALSGIASRGEIELALDGGANGFISKSVLGHEFVRAVRAICEGENQARAQSYGVIAHDRQVSVRFTEREQDVLGLLQGGMTNKEMARELGLSPETVKIYVKSIGDKLGSRNRTDLIVRALEVGAIQHSA